MGRKRGGSGREEGTEERRERKRGGNGREEGAEERRERKRGWDRGRRSRRVGLKVSRRRSNRFAEMQCGFASERARAIRRNGHAPQHERSFV